MKEFPCGIGIDVELQRRRGILKPGVQGAHRTPNQVHTLLKFPKMLCVLRWHKQASLQSQQFPVCS